MKNLIGLAIGILVFLPAFVFAQANIPCPPGTPAGITCLPNPLGKFGIYDLGDLVVRAIQGFVAIIALVAIAFVVFSGFKLVIATSEDAIKSARQSLTWAVGGFVVALLSFTVISGTAIFLGFDPNLVGLGTEEQANYTLKSPLSGPADPNQFISVMNFVMVNVLGLIVFATVFIIIYHGYRYITSAGNEEIVEKAKQGLKWAVVGFVASLLAFTIITAIRNYLVLSATP